MHIDTISVHSYVYTYMSIWCIYIFIYIQLLILVVGQLIAKPFRSLIKSYRFVVEIHTVFPKYVDAHLNDRNTQTRTYRPICIYICMYTGGSISLSLYIYICLYTHIYTNVYMYICINIYIYILIYTSVYNIVALFL